MASATVDTADAYVLNGKSWASGSNVVLQLGLGEAGRTLSDGNTNWNAAVAPSLDAWNKQIARIQLGKVMNSTAGASSGDRVNTVIFSNSVFGTAFGNGTLAVTYYIMQGSNLIEADVLFNAAQVFDSYRGPLRFASSGYATADIRRVFLHELGHAIGMNHAAGDVIMNALISDREDLATDDINGAQSMYGAAALPQQPPASVGSSSLVNISTRMKVGLNDDVLIGGFILKGTQPKKMLLRAIGPSLTNYGVKGAISDPIIELHDAKGAIIAQNDDWPNSAQSTEIVNTGKAPGNALEAALVVTLNPGTYTAIVRGVDNTQGVALVEGYELDAPSTRLVNLSTRGRIGVNDEVLIGGFIVDGDNGKQVAIRALGPSLAAFLSGSMADPALDVYNSSGVLVASNDNWSTGSQRTDIIASGQAPSHPLDSALVATLGPGSYTAIVHGVNSGTGIGLVEVYDLQP